MRYQVSTDPEIFTLQFLEALLATGKNNYFKSDMVKLMIEYEMKQYQPDINFALRLHVVNMVIFFVNILFIN